VRLKYLVKNFLINEEVLFIPTVIDFLFIAWWLLNTYTCGRCGIHKSPFKEDLSIDLKSWYTFSPPVLTQGDNLSHRWC